MQPATWQCYSVATGIAGGVAAAFCGRLTATFFAAFREAFTGAFLAAFLAGDCWTFAAARFAAQRFFNATTIAALPAALSLRFVLGATGDDGADSFLDSAHRFRWASRMRFRAAALIFRRLGIPLTQQTTICRFRVWRTIRGRSRNSKIVFRPKKAVGPIC